MNSKRGVVGSIVMLFIGTIAIVALLAAYVFGSGLISLLDVEGVAVYSEGDIDSMISHDLIQEVISEQINFYKLYFGNILSGGFPQ
ncbi:hypothetical protein HN604_03645 [archaeon]|jgi:hypothetical protein|nr:hypothetical protein [archaeon]MBT6182521.1 hypothetical protein [archaeon]MBT6606019.1 hypothetical protein [archaeon]MBT7251662.1 hypothetical protein [archaeon]MBT7661147.1 hypothetical protein [archaeon]